MSKKKSLSTVTASAVKELAENAKRIKAQKEAMKFLVVTARKFKEIEQMEKSLDKFVKDSKLGKDLLKEAKSLTVEDIEALEEMLEEPNKDTKWILTTDGTYTAYNNLN